MVRGLGGFRCRFTRQPTLPKDQSEIVCFGVVAFQISAVFGQHADALAGDIQAAVDRDAVVAQQVQAVGFLRVVKAVHDNQDLLRASVLTESNSYRLGANEAPPAIMSVFLGSYLTGMLDDLVRKVSGKKMSPTEKTELKLGIGKIPEILLDNTDRNRTSPFAFIYSIN